MKSLRALPPAASVLSLRDFFSGITGMFHSQHTLESFQSSIKKFFASKYCFLLSSGKAALTTVLQALRELHPDRNEVIIPAFNCYSVPSAIIRARLTIRPCEVNPQTLQFDPETFKSIITNNSSHILAVCPTHFYGYPSDFNLLQNVINNKEITIIEDAAQVMGGSFRGKLFGTFGDVSIFSLSRGKALSAGEGGIILTNRDDIGSCVTTLLKNVPDYSSGNMLKLIFINFLMMIFIYPSLFWLPRCIPHLKIGETIFDPSFSIFKLSRFQAGLLKNWQLRLSADLYQRHRRCKLYRSMLDNINGLSFIDGCLFDFQPASIRFPVFIENSNLVDSILSESERLGLGISRTYPDSIDRIPDLILDKVFALGAKKVTESIITLPCHSLVLAKDIRKIVATLKRILIS